MTTKHSSGNQPTGMLQPSAVGVRMDEHTRVIVRTLAQSLRNDEYTFMKCDWGSISHDLQRHPGCFALFVSAL